MKKLMLASLMVAAFPALADDPAACKDYYAAVEADLKKNDAYSEDAMKIAKDQIAAVPADQKEAVCKAAIESMKEDAADDGAEEADDKEEGKEESKG